MSRFLPYSPEQAYLLPPSVKDELGEDHLSMFLHRVVERLDTSGFERAYSEEGGELYAPTLMLKVWFMRTRWGSRVRDGCSSAFGKIWDCVIWRVGSDRITGR